MVTFLKKSLTSYRHSVLENICTIPLNETSYVPQGVCSIKDNILVSCYDSEHINNSVIFIYNNGIYKTIYLDGKMHCGGIQYHEKSDSVFVTGKGKNNNAFVNRYSGKKLLALKDLSTISVENISCVDDKGDLYSTAAKHSSAGFLTCYENNLIVGNFVDFKKTNKSYLKIFKILSNGDLSHSSEIIDNPFSNTQGLCLIKYRNKVHYVFSRSFGRNRNSILNICELNNDKFNVLNTIIMPCMSEQVSVFDNNLIVIFESCASKYSSTAINVNDSVVCLSFEELLKYRDNFRDFCRGDRLFVNNSGIKIEL